MEGSKKVGKLLKTLLMGAFGLLFISPFLFMLSSSFKPLGEVFEYPVRLIPKSLFLDNYSEIFADKYMFVRWYFNSIVMTALLIVIKSSLTAVTAYGFSRLRFKGRDFIFLTMLAVIIVPSDVTLIQRYVIYKFLYLTDTMWAVILPASFDIFLVFLLRQFLLTVPFELSEAATIDGCGHFRTFYRVILPLAVPAMVTVIIFSFIWAWNDYAGPFIFITDTRKQMLTVGISMFSTMKADNYAMQMAAATLALVPIFALFLFTQKYFVAGIATSGLKG